MTKEVSLKVHLLNFHGRFTHISIVLENVSTNPATFYLMDRWVSPLEQFSAHAKFKNFQ